MTVEQGDGWCRQCALCGSVDDSMSWPSPADAAVDWCCSRCDSVRWLWSSTPARDRQAEAS